MTPAYIEIKTNLRGKNVPSNALYAHQKCRCFYCNRYMPFARHSDQKGVVGFTRDHLLPRSKGYGFEGNTVLACRLCNERKENRWPTLKEMVKAWELYQRMGRPFIATIILP